MTVKIMRNYALAAATFLAFTTAALADPQVNTKPGAAPSGQYNADTNHTQVVFSILHMGISPYFGRITGATGTLQYDAAKPEKSSVTIDLDASTINTPNDKLTGELKAADAFNVTQFPKITFTSTSIKKTGADKGDIMGNLTFLGVTKPVTLYATFHGSAPNMGGKGQRIGFGAITTIKRSDFGMAQARWSPFLSDKVDLMIEAEFVQDTK